MRCSPRGRAEEMLMAPGIGKGRAGPSQPALTWQPGSPRARASGPSRWARCRFQAWKRATGVDGAKEGDAAVAERTGQPHEICIYPVIEEHGLGSSSKEDAAPPWTVHPGPQSPSPAPHVTLVQVPLSMGSAGSIAMRTRRAKAI